MPDQNPPRKQEGGFMMSDKGISGPETLYSIMKTHFDKVVNKTFFDSVLQQTSSPPKKDISFLNSSPYTDIYTKLINIIMTDEVYTQTFSDGSSGGKPFFTQAGMHNYHIQLCALMTMSFLIELELFSVVHNYIPINIGITGPDAKKNKLPSIYAHSTEATTTPLRCYKPSIQGGVEEMLNYFTQSLDAFFNNFMNLLVDEIYTRIDIGKTIFSSKEDLLEEIVPVKSRVPNHVTGTFDFIYVNWKERIKAKIKNKLGIDDTAYTAGKYSMRINSAIERALRIVEDGGSRYIAEGTGFFSFLYLLAAVPGVVYNGSCITYSMLELYIMARLHVHADNLILEMESAHSYAHQYWKSVQADTDINLKSVTHWTTKYNFQSKPLHFRHVFSDSIKQPPSGKPSFNFVDPDKPNLCLLLLYPIFDSYIRYIGPMTDTVNKNIVSDFIKKRIEFVKTLFTTHKTVSKHVLEHGVRGRVIGTTDKVSVPPIRENWFSEVFGFNEIPFATHKDSFHVKKNPKPTESEHILMTVKGTEIDVGVFRYMSVEDLLKTATSNPSTMSVFGFDPKNLKYYTMTSPAHMVHMTPSYSGSIFQVASQFNALEMADPDITPQVGITNYWNDKTQGPVCAMVCPFGTLYRNYFCMPADGKQPEDKSVNDNPQTGIDAAVAGSVNDQINTLTELMKIPQFTNLRFQNGYIFVKDKGQLDAINTYLSTPENFWTAMMAIKYVIQEDTPVVDVTTGDGKILDQIVSQIYCSAYPVSYSTDIDPVTKAPPRVPGTTAKDYALLSSMILHAVYYSTLAYAVTRITSDETRKKVFLTRVGGGVFKNEVSLIDNAIYNAVSHFIAYPIDVYVVEYQPDTIKDPEVKPLTSVSSPYPDIQTALEKKAKDETAKVQNATVLKVAADKLAADKAKAEKAAADKLHDEKAEKKHLKLKDATDEAIKTFSEKLTAGGDDDKKYAKILDDLMVMINKNREVRAKVDADAEELAKSKTSKKTKGKVKKLEPESVSKKMSLDDVNKFIDSHTDAIFVVTGGSFNPPHNGHIGMFQKAYDRLKAKSKTVYGVMVPATEDWLDKKVASKKLDKSQKIDINDRVNLCTLSCDSYNWTSDPAKFNASNMIVVNDGNDGPAGSILTKGVRDNAYYLCGSDYYASSGAGKYKFICVLRSGVELLDGPPKHLKFDKPPTDDPAKTEFDVKADDIIIDGGGVDNDASSTLLRDILTKINEIVVTDGGFAGSLPDKDKLLALISIPVLRKLLKLKYILTEPVKNKQILELMDIKLEDIIEDDVHVEHTDKPDHYLSTGIRNGPAFCYLNSAFQLLFSIETLRNWVDAAPLDILESATRIERCAIKLLKLIINSSNTPKQILTGGDKLKTRIEKETKKTAGPRFVVGGQNDSHEVLVPIIDAFLTKHPDSVNELKFTEYELQTKEGATTKGTTVRTKCITDPINITIATVNSIQTALDNNKSTAKARKSETDKTEIDLLTEFQYQFEPDNRYFIIYLNRTSTTEVGGMNKKHITVDKHITVTQKQAPPPPDTAAEKVYKFKLRGAILKSGSAKGGHYKYISYENGADADSIPITYDSPNVYASIDSELTGDNSIECYSSIFLYEKDS